MIAIKLIEFYIERFNDDSDSVFGCVVWDYDFTGCGDTILEAVCDTISCIEHMWSEYVECPKDRLTGKALEFRAIMKKSFKKESNDTDKNKTLANTGQ